MKVGSNQLNCLVPFAFLGRYFIWEKGLISVVVEHEGNPIYEILNNEPNQNRLTDVVMSAPGIITVSDLKTDKFLYKIRPGSETSIIFGTLSEGDITATINDREIKIGTNTFSNNTVQAQIGIIVTDDGAGIRIAVGAPFPQFLQRLFFCRTLEKSI